MKKPNIKAVKIKSLDWYNENKNEYGEVPVRFNFVKEMARFCGKTLKVRVIGSYNDFLLWEKPGIKDTGFSWSEQMFEKIYLSYRAMKI